MDPRNLPTSSSGLKRLRGVIFDYGNTLVRLDPSVRSARTDYADVVARPGAESLGVFLERAGAIPERRQAAFVERFLEVRERNRKQAEEHGQEIVALQSLRETLLDLTLPVPAEADLEAALTEFFRAEVELIRPMPGAGELLKALRDRGLRLAMLSNATCSRTIADVVGRMGWAGHFDPLVVSADIGVRKPRPEAFRAVLDRWTLNPEEVAMVGDSLYHDVGGARALGLMTIHFAAIPNAFDGAVADSVRPGFTVASHEELRRLLL
jgi:putative hydrolase of the HAD superfamily